MMLILRVAVQAYLSSYNNKLYSRKRPCPRCGSKNVVKRGTETRLFCKLIADGFEDVKVRGKRLQCMDCNAQFYAQAPFYKNCVYAIPIVDLSLAFAANMPYNRGEAVFTDLGIQVDRETIEHYCKLFWEKAEKYAGLSFLGTKLALNILKILTGAENVEKLREKLPEIIGGGEEEVVIAGVADETYPTKKGAKKKHREENQRRKKEGKKPLPYPKGFTLATAYLPALSIFASLVVQDVDFNFLLALLLMQSLKGTDYNIVGGEPSYNGTCDNLKRCTIHRRRRIADKDHQLQELKKNDLAAYLEKYKALHDHLKEEFYKELIKEKIGKKPPAEELPTSTNSMEGGNWRLKYLLATLYWTCCGLRGRVLLLCLRDSLKTFSGADRWRTR
ncbi:MAG: hypothetical protein ACUVXA_08365 [Candidatus Jordarchaeum sp.]|uniref:hypothetical protein n=1 Tax=Candidatus Jordarchaeum sp. TaxID=2823881 RepID=UPI00404A3F3A